MYDNVPFHFFTWARQCFRILFAQERTQSQHVSLEIAIPVDLFNVELEFGAVGDAHVSDQLTHIIIGEVPLVRREIFETAHRLRQFVLDFDHSVNDWKDELVN